MRQKHDVQSLSQSKTMEWLVNVLKEASRVKGNIVKRWKLQDCASHLFCARNFNKQGRYISIINFQVVRRAGIIIPEITFNEGWSEVAFKLRSFIYYNRQKSAPHNF